MAQVERATSTGGKKYLTRVLSTLQYQGYNIGWSGYGITNTGFYFLGYNWQSSIEEINASSIQIRAYIPEDFVIEKAEIIFQHYPIYWFDGGGGLLTYGYCRNINVYNVTNKQELYVWAGYESDWGIFNFPTETIIPGAFGDSGYTAPATTEAADALYAETYSKDIKDYLVEGDNLLSIHTSDVTPDWAIDNSATVAAKTGFAKAIINITGYRR